MLFVAIHRRSLNTGAVRQTACSGLVVRTWLGRVAGATVATINTVLAFAIDRRDSHAESVRQTAGADFLVARCRRQTVGAVAEVQSTGRDALSLGGDYATSAGDTATTFFRRRASKRATHGTVSHVQSTMLDTIYTRHDDTGAVGQTASALFSAGAEKRRTRGVVTLIDSAGLLAGGGGQDLARQARNTASAAWRVTIDGGAWNAVAKVDSTHPLTFVGKDFDTSRSCRSLNTAGALLGAVAYDTSAGDIVTLIDAAM